VQALALDEQRARRSGRIGHLQTCAKASVAGVLLIAQTGGGVATVPCVTLIGRFRMGDVFPPDDPVARFVVTVAMFANDLFRSTRMFGQLGEDVHEARGRRLMLVRYQASVFYEISLFIADARRVPPVAEFIDSLPDEAATDAARMTESTRELDPWLRTHQRLGAAILGPAPRSMLITGTVCEWESLRRLHATGRALPDRLPCL